MPTTNECARAAAREWHQTNNGWQHGVIEYKVARRFSPITVTASAAEFVEEEMNAAAVDGGGNSTHRQHVKKVQAPCKYLRSLRWLNFDVSLTLPAVARIVSSHHMNQPIWNDVMEPGKITDEQKSHHVKSRLPKYIRSNRN